MNGMDPFPHLTVRPVRPDDAERVTQEFERMSPATVYKRFFTVFRTPRRALVQLLVEVDHHDHESLVVLDGDDVVALARWDRPVAGAPEAEACIHIEDAWQHRGLGRVLMDVLSTAALAEGISTFTAEALCGNHAAVALARSRGGTVVHLGGPTVEIRAPLVIA